MVEMVDTMKKQMIEKILQLYPGYHTVYGPYLRKDGRKIIVLYDGEKRTAKQYARIKIEVYLERRLTKKEEVDHKDNDYTNDHLKNLQVLSKSDNIRKSRTLNKLKVKCVWCGGSFVLTYEQRKARSKKKAGPFCGRSCSGKYAQYVQVTGINYKRTKRKTTYRS